MNAEFLYIGSALIFLWGVAHIFPTKSVVAGFGALSEDNKRIIIMEWVGEGLALCFLGVLVFAVTISTDTPSSVAVLVIRLAAAMSFIMGVWTFIIGFKTSVIPIKICPLILTGVALLFFLVVDTPKTRALRATLWLDHTSDESQLSTHTVLCALVPRCFRRSAEHSYVDVPGSTIIR